MMRPCSDRGIFRFLAIATLAALVVTLAVALPGVSADGGEDGKRDDYSHDQAPPIPDKGELNYPNLGSHLDQLLTSVEEGQATSLDAAGYTPVHSGASVAVTIYLSGSVDDVVTFLEDNGGDPRNVGEDYIEAYVPVTLLGQLSQQPGVARVREIVPPQPAQTMQQIIGHGPAVHGSQAWNQAGWSGKGVKVGIIDTGFTGFDSLMETELPTTVVARCYTDVGVFTQDLADCEAAPNVTDVRPPQCLDYARRRAASGDPHGTKVAESLIDIAPGVELYIANPYSPGDLQATAAWMASQGVSVINHSVGWPFDGPGDGNSPISASPLNTVDLAVASDVTWVNAAGNSADDTWFGGYSDPDGNRALGFGGQNDEVIDIHIRECQSYTVQLRWEDTWDGASTDLDLYLYDKYTRELVPYSFDEQSGESGHVPFEGFGFRSAIETRDLGIAVIHHSGKAPDWVQITVRGQGNIQHHTKNGSITNPAESANLGMLAVGAAHWNDVRAIEPYSSRGPTPDERDKPDIVGADCGATTLSPLNEYNQGFCGTSQASPHVAGLAALVRQRFPDYTPAQVASYLKDNAEQRQSPDPNSTWGHGFAKLPPPDGTARPTTPAPSNAFTRNPAADFDGLQSAGNTLPLGIWSDGETMWVVDFIEEKIYAYDLATKARVPGKDFDTLKASGNTWPQGIWSDGTTMWAADFIEEKIYAYDLATKARVPGKDFDTLKASGNTWPQGIWSDGTTMWAADFIEEKIYAYDLATKARVPGKDFDTLKASGNTWPQGIWSDGTTMWVADSNYDKVYAYDMATKARVPAKEFNTLEAAGNWIPRGIWSDGATMWAADSQDAKIYSYLMPQAVSPDRAALVALYNATGGANWTNNTNWLTTAPVGQWYGVTTDANGWVTELNLTRNQLKGEIPPELANLTNLKVLALGGNELTGTIPTWLGSLATLEELYLWGNELTGEIPSELGNLTNLKVLALGGNELTGTIPTWLGSLATLEELWLSENQLTGEIPVELGSLANLVELVLWGNGLTGAIPTELGSLANLEVLALADNQSTGEIPVELGTLANLTLLSLSQNQLTGAIPAELGSLANLEVLALSDNQLTGEIPVELGNLANLKVLALGGNELTGTIPTWLGSLATLEELWLSENQLTGEIPVDLGSLANLTLLSLSQNQLTGAIPTELGSLANLEVLALSDNQLTGEIPVELGNLANLKVLALGGNELTGTIPTWLGSLANLEELWLSENQLTGEIPVELGNLANLKVLALGGNELTGTIPTWLGSLANLEELWLSENQLTGEIPVELGSRSNLVELVLWGNGLTGAIPTELGSLANLEVLALSDNQLTGEIPVELGTLAKLKELWLSENQLTGKIPVELGSLSNLVKLVLWGNELTGEIPVELGTPANLTSLSISQNQLTGAIPTELGSLAKLVELQLADNQLTGTIPTELGSLSNLELLSLSGNQLTGMIPQTLVGLTMLESFIFHNNPGLCAPIDDAFQTWLGSISTVLGSSCAPADSPEDRAVLIQVHSATDGANWTNNTNWLSEEHFIREWYGVTNDANGRVHGLFLEDNQLAGEIPPELGSLSNLELLSLSANQLTGEIPAEMGSLANLRSLSLRNNQLSGEIPPEVGSLANLEWLRLNNNQLTGEIPAELGRLTNLTVLHLSGNQLTGCVPAGLKRVPDNDFAQLGLPFCPSYDANGDGAIDIGELFSAIDDYFDGAIGIGELFTIIDLYFSGPTPTATTQPPGAPTGLTATANGPGNQEWPGVRPGNHTEHSAP